MATDKQQAPAALVIPDGGLQYGVMHPASRLGKALSLSHDPAGESSEDHRDRLFLQVLLSLALNIVALIWVFYFLLPLSETGRARGGLLLWAVLAITVGITAIFLRFGGRVVCANLLLLMLGGVLFGASFILGGVMSPTMIFLLAVPVLAGTLMQASWAYFWTMATVCAWLVTLVLQYTGMEMTRVTQLANVGVVQVISLLGTVLVVMAVLRSHVTAANRLRIAMEHKNERLDYLARHDSLTSIPNRRSFFAHAQHCLQRSSRTNIPFALLVIDLNDFKKINDDLGHKVGDAVLLHFARRMSTGFRDSDFIGRLGGDEFGVLLEPVENAAGVAEAIERFHSSGLSALAVDGSAVQYEFAVGTALYPQDGDSIPALYETADAAMYRSKKGVPSAFLWK